MPGHHPLDDLHDPEKWDLALEKAMYCDLVGGIEDGRHRLAGPAGFIGETNGWEALMVHRQKLEVPDLSEIEPGQARVRLITDRAPCRP